LGNAAEVVNAPENKKAQQKCWAFYFVLVKFYLLRRKLGAGRVEGLKSFGITDTRRSMPMPSDSVLKSSCSRNARCTMRRSRELIGPNW
jgi:hypothetical protein